MPIQHTDAVYRQSRYRAVIHSDAVNGYSHYSVTDYFICTITPERNLMRFLPFQVGLQFSVTPTSS